MKGTIINKTTLTAFVFFILITLIGTNAASVDISKEVAYQIVIDDVLDGEVDSKEIYVSEVYLTPGKGAIDLPKGEGWYFFIDDQPDMDWGHPCRYVYIDNFGNVTVESSIIPPLNFEDMELLTIRPVVTTPTAADAPEKFRSMGGAEEFVQKNIEDAAYNASEHCYAVLISGGVNKFNNYYPRYYNNISSYYKYLKTDLQFHEEHIYVLYADGNDTDDDYQLVPKTFPPTYGNSNPDFDGDGVEDVDYACTLENLTKVFDILGTKLGPKDYLFIYVYDHGGIWDNPGEMENATINLWNWVDITDDDFANNVSKVNCAAKMVVMGQCYSGGMVQELVDTNTNITVAASCGDEPNRGYMFLMPWLDAHKTGYDLDSSYHTEQDEAYDYAKTHANQPGGIQPRYDEKPIGFGGTVCLCKCSWTTTEEIEKGLCYLRNHQNTDGSWSNNVGTTSLAALSFMNAGYNETDPTVQKAIDYILSKVQGDGSIYSIYYNRTYETSLATLALVATYNNSYSTTTEDAANWLNDSQWDENCSWGSVNKDNWYYGGFGYGRNVRPDLSNTQFALMALDSVLNVSKDDLLWDKAQVFLARDQMRQANVAIPDINYTVVWNPSYNKYNDGGFVYHPGDSLSTTGTSYGSMTAAGIWSLRLCDASTNDSRVQAALDWHKGHYTWTQNPGMSPDARRFQYYYYLAFSKALMMTVGNQEFDGHDWYADLSANLTALQHPDGHWVNTYTGHGSEGDPNVVTSYSILALEVRQIPTNIQRLSWLTFILHSNADLHIYDPLGRHVGMNYETGEIENEIPGATYSNNGVQEINIPNLELGNYIIELVGTGDGEYTLDVTGGVGDTIVSEDSFTSTITSGEVHEANVNVAMITGLTIHIEGPEPEETHATIKKDFRYADVNFGEEPANLGDFLLDPNDNGEYNVRYVIRKKDYTVASTNPGQLYGVINITGAGITNISINDTFGSQFNVNPGKLGGGVEVIRLNSTSGNAMVLTDTANVSSAEVNNDINRVKLIINLTEPLKPNEHLMVYVKFKTALKHKIPDYSDFINQAKVYVDNGGLLAAQATIEFE